MSALAVMRRLWKNREVLLKLLDFFEGAARGISKLAELRARIANGAERGDLDDVLKKFASTTDVAEDFIDHG